jgi:DNA polymerase III epsilon subunit-like protein
MQLFLDIETSSLLRGQICQLAYVTDGDGAVTAKNFYFEVDGIDPGSYRVHRLKANELKVLSGGRRFGDCAAEILADLTAANRVFAHNFQFEYDCLSREFARLGLPFSLSNGFCTMQYFTPHCKLGGTGRNTYKYPSLEELAAHFNITETDALAAAADIFGEPTRGLHDARYDTAILRLCVKKSGVFKVES